MSNLLKSKTFKVGGLVIAVAMMFVIGGAVSALAQSTTTTTTVVASGFTYSGTMRAGMSGPGISTLQAALNSVNGVAATIVVDGKFGPATLASVKQFQMSHGLVADGVVGPKTGAALAQASITVITVPSNYPSGCTSNGGFSTTTGQSCAVSYTLPSGCSSTSGYSSTTGARCDSGSSSSLPSGCSSTSGYSSTTGARCDSGSSSSLPAGCSSTSGFSSSTGARCDSGSTNDTSLSGGETSISGLSVNDADDDTINEGQSKATVADIQFDVSDADAQLIRADIVFQSNDGQTGEETKPWRAFDKAYLMDGNTVLASADASNQNSWTDAADVNTATTDNQAYRIRFNNINKIYSEGSNNNDLWVAVDVASSVNGSDANPNAANWLVGVDSNGLRFADGAGLTTEIGKAESNNDTASFSIVSAGAESGFNVTKSSSNPNAQTLKVSETSSTTATVAVFKAKADTNGGDVKIDDFPITLTIGGTGTKSVDDVVSDVMLVIDGTTYSSDTTPAHSITQTFHFTDIANDDVIVNAGDSKDVTVKVKFRSQGTNGTTYGNGVTIRADANLADTDVEDADSGDSLPAGSVNGSSTGETMTLAGNGISVDINSATTTVTPNADAGFNDGYTFTWNIDVTAFGNNDVYINKDNADVVTVQDANDVDTVYTVQQSGGTALPAGAGTVSTSSGADIVNGDTLGHGGTYNGETFFKIAAGDTETFTITVSGTNSLDSKQVQAYLSDIEFTTDNVASTAVTPAAAIQHYTANLANDSQTGYKQVQ